ncbi:hypothetical protein D3C80_1287320 [compost metagenome]
MPERFADIAHHIAAAELGGRHVDRHHDLARPLARPGTRLVNDPVAQQHDQVGLFGQRDEAVRTQQSEARVLPAHQCLGRSDRGAIDLEPRLEMQAQFSARNALAQLTLQLAFFQ